MTEPTTPTGRQWWQDTQDRLVDAVDLPTILAIEAEAAAAGARDERERLRADILPLVESIENLSDRGVVFEQAARIRRRLADPEDA